MRNLKKTSANLVAFAYCLSMTVVCNSLYAASSGSGGGGALSWSCHALAPWGGTQYTTGCEVWSPNGVMFYLAESVQFELDWIECFSQLQIQPNPQPSGFNQYSSGQSYTNSVVPYYIEIYTVDANFLKADVNSGYAIHRYNQQDSNTYTNPVGPFHNSLNSCI